jgi:Fe-S oxidoreductase
MEAGSIRFQPQPAAENVSFHDPCYLSRINDSGEAAYSILEKSGDSLLKQAYRHTSTWCCGAGGTQIWKESSTSGNAINQTRFNQLTDSTTQKLITACPFCKTMLTDANQKADAKIKVQDLSEYMLEKMIRENE